MRAFNVEDSGIESSIDRCIIYRAIWKLWEMACLEGIGLWDHVLLVLGFLLLLSGYHHRTVLLGHGAVDFIGYFVSAIESCLSAPEKRTLPRTQVLYLTHEVRGTTSHLNEEVSSPQKLPV